MRAAIERRVERRDQSDTNVKEGRGTIREIEFMVQLLQLLFGARRSALRTGNTLEALVALEGEGLLSAEERARFAEHYRFFRTVEHRLQMLHDLPVRLVPDDPDEQRKLALRMGFPPSEAGRFMEIYRARAGEVQRLSRGILDRLTEGGVAAADPLRLMILALAPQSGVQLCRRRVFHIRRTAGIAPRASSPSPSPLPSPCRQCQPRFRCRRGVRFRGCRRKASDQSSSRGECRARRCFSARRICARRWRASPRPNR